MGQKCCMSCLDLENVYIYRITRFSTNKYQVQLEAGTCLADELSELANFEQDPSFPAAVASAWNVVQTTLTPAAKLVDSLKKVQKFAETWREGEVYKGNDAKTHADKLTEGIEQSVDAGNNVLIPIAQEADLPPEPIRGTPFEKLMVAVLQNTSVAGFYALHAEPGAGKSTAATLAALELKGRQPKDVIVLLQNDFERQLKSFFRLSNIE
eukprot:s8756_g2.t2